MNKFLPVSADEVKKRRWDSLDFIFVSGDAYVDHPSFGHAIITRVLEYMGFKVGVIPQPSWKSKDDFMRLGKPKIAFLVSSGNIDSMVNHYTASKKRRNTDLYSPGGKSGYRPDRAVIVYCNRIREAYGDIPIIIGGIEASLRRFAHYDYWDDKVRNSILVDSSADLLIYGMGEKPLFEISNLVKYGKNIRDIKDVKGTCYISDSTDGLTGYIELPSLESVSSDRKQYAKAFKIQYEEQDSITGKTLIQKHGIKYVVQNPPAASLNQPELDLVYDLPYTRQYHPMYKDKGGIPAINEVEFSLASQRGCFGGCSFCALHFHQGRVVQPRSDESIIKEAELLTKQPGFKGYIHDVGGPTANFRNPSCEKQLTKGICKNKQCMFPEPCRNLKVDHSEYLHLLRKLRKLPGVKKVFIRSGIRYDYLIYDKNQEFFNELVKYHISGQLKVAPEHISDNVLKYMGKPSKKVYDRFVQKYFDINKKYGLNQFLVPYFISGHPGSDLKAAIELAEFIRDMGYTPEQVQDFYPTPGSLSTAMYYTGVDPLTGEKLYVARTPEEKAMQRALLQFKVPSNYDLVYKALKLANRSDLIGSGKKCLIPSNPPSNKSSSKLKSNKTEHKHDGNKAIHKKPAVKYSKRG